MQIYSSNGSDSTPKSSGYHLGIYIPHGWYVHRSMVAVMQHHCCVVDEQCRAQALTLPPTRLDKPVGLQSIHAQKQYATNSQRDSHAALECQIQWMEVLV